MKPGPIASPSAPARRGWLWPLAIFLFLATAQLVLIAGAGVDIPFHDQWTAEGFKLCAAWRDGSWQWSSLFAGHGEHRIVWTKALNLALFVGNGQWDPLLEMMVGALLHGAIAALLVRCFLGGRFSWSGAWFVAGVALLTLPIPAWNNALWGFQSQVYFCVFFSALALYWLGRAAPEARRVFAGLGAGIAAMLAMGGGRVVPVALVGMWILRVLECRRCTLADLKALGPALFLLAFGWLVRVEVEWDPTLYVSHAMEFFRALGQMLAWPHVTVPVAALAVHAPLLLVVAGRLAHRRPAAPGEDFALLLAGWTVATALGIAWARGAGYEFRFGVTPRYVDFFILLPIANLWCVGILFREAPAHRRRLAQAGAAAWAVFVFVGWLGLAAVALRNVIVPRWRDREAPVRLTIAFQHTGDPGLLIHQPLAIIPSIDADSLHRVLHDPRLAGVLPPSLQPDQPVRFWSRLARRVVGWPVPPLTAPPGRPAAP